MEEMRTPRKRVDDRKRLWTGLSILLGIGGFSLATEVKILDEKTLFIGGVLFLCFYFSVLAAWEGHRTIKVMEKMDRLESLTSESREKS